MKTVNLATVESKIADVKAQRDALVQSKANLIQEHSAEIDARVKELLQLEVAAIKEKVITEKFGDKIATIDADIKTADLLIAAFESVITVTDDVTENTEETETENI